MQGNETWKYPWRKLLEFVVVQIPVGKEMTVNLCRISRKNHFRPPVCKNYSHFILSVQARSSLLRLQNVFCFSSARLGNKWHLAYHRPISARKTLFTCVLYTLGLPHQQKAHRHFELETLDWFRPHVPRLIDISDPNCPLFQKKPLLCPLPSWNVVQPCQPTVWHEMLAGV